MTRPVTTPGRHPGGRTISGSGANRGRGICFVALPVSAVVAFCLIWVAARIIQFAASTLAGAL